MKCEICEENEAVVHIQQMIGSEVFEMHLCEACAKEKGIESSEDKIELSLSELLTGLVDLTDVSEKEKTRQVCPQCGKTFDEFRKDGKLGCAECYNSFHNEISQLLTNVSGNQQHKGKFPAKLKAYKTIIIDKEAMKQKLQKAIEDEDYESAAVLRDRIRELDHVIEENNA
jgi:protein arginine kinase activator